MKLLGLLLLISLSHTCFSQIFYSGKVVSKSTGKAIPYATVGLIKQKVGTNADETGEFSLLESAFDNDSLMISCVGFIAEKIPVQKFHTVYVVELIEKATTLPDIKVMPGQKEINLNEFSNCGFSFYTSNGTVTQIAQLFEVPHSGVFLQKVRICHSGASCMFRIRIYDIDTALIIPKGDLIDSIIEVKTTKRNVVVNLEPYNIFVPGKFFFVAIEWIFNPYNAYKNKIKYPDGSKQMRLAYVPDISLGYQSSGDSALQMQTNVWELFFDGRWKPISYWKNRRLLISVQVK